MCTYDALQIYLHRANKSWDIAHPQGSPITIGENFKQLPNYYRKFKMWRARENCDIGWHEEQDVEQGTNLRRKGSKGNAEGWTPIKRTKGHVSFVI